MKKIPLIIILFVVSFISYGDTIEPDYYEFTGDKDKFKNYIVRLNPSLNPYEDPNLLNQLMFDGKRPSAIVVQRKPASYPKSNEDGYFYYLYDYYCFYGEFKQDKFIVRDDEYIRKSHSTSGILEKLAVRTNAFVTKDNSYDGKIIKYGLTGYNFHTNNYSNIKFKKIYFENQFSIYQSLPYKVSFGGLNESYIFYTPENKQLFFYGNGNPFFQGLLQSPTKNLEIIPKMVNLAVVFLVGLITLLIVLRVSLKALRIFLPI